MTKPVESIFEEGRLEEYTTGVLRSKRVLQSPVRCKHSGGGEER